MPATSQDLFLTAGDTVEILVDTDQTLTGGTLSWTLIDRSGDAAVTKTTASGITIDPDDATVAIVALDPADTADLLGPHYHELEVTDGSGNVTTLTTGVVNIRQGVN